MSDIVERLRVFAGSKYLGAKTCGEAADEIDRLREALEKIISDQHRAGLGEGENNEYTAVARAALAKEQFKTWADAYPLARAEAERDRLREALEQIKARASVETAFSGIDDIARAALSKEAGK